METFEKKELTDEGNDDTMKMQDTDFCNKLDTSVYLFIMVEIKYFNIGKEITCDFFKS